MSARIDKLYESYLKERIKQHLKHSDMIQNIYNIARRNGGITFNVMSGELDPKEGYMVSLKGHEETSPVLTPDGILGYIADKKDFFSEDVYLGLWKADYWYYDLSILVRNKEIAMVIAERNGQKAIYDLKERREIQVVSELNQKS